VATTYLAAVVSDAMVRSVCGAIQSDVEAASTVRHRRTPSTPATVLRLGARGDLPAWLPAARRQALIGTRQ
jgi:hypothetical protein